MSSSTELDDTIIRPTDLKMPINPIPVQMYSALSAHIQKTIECRNNPAPFTELKNESLIAFTGALKVVNGKFSRYITFNEANSIRHAIMLTIIFREERRIDAAIDAIAGMYESGQNIMVLSSIYWYPPVRLLEKIFATKGLTEPYENLSERDQAAMTLASLHDDDNFVNREKRKAEAEAAEKKFIDWVTLTGVTFKTQEDLVKEQIAEFGGPVATPDILFTSPVTINKTQVNWIEFKNYTGVPEGILYESNRRQVIKYKRRWGLGAIVYRSFVDTTMFPNTITLNL